MADWKQITSRDPGGQLTLLYEKTSDAMVAFELGRHFEIAKDSAQSLQWYLTAATKFRRGEWKTKAREAVVRLGGELPPDLDPAPSPISETLSTQESTDAALTIPDPALSFEAA